MSGWFRRKKRAKKKRKSESSMWEDMQRMSQQFKEEELRLREQRKCIDKKKARLEALGIEIDESSNELDTVELLEYQGEPPRSEMEIMMVKMSLKFQEEKIKLDILEKRLDRLEKAYDDALEEIE